MVTDLSMPVNKTHNLWNNIYLPLYMLAICIYWTEN
jgi:hypothetical protein